MRNRDKKDRVLGPYKSGRRWIVAVVVGSTGKRTLATFSAEQAARNHARQLRSEIAKIEQTTVAAAISEYRRHLEKKGNKANSVTQTTYRITSFFSEEELPVSMLDTERCTGYYNARAAKLSADTHRNLLSEAKTFLRWCVKQRWLRSNPLEGVEGFGKRRRGKPQLRIDEARKWLAAAVEDAEKGNVGAIAAMMALLLGLRAGEIISRAARDVDDDGHVLWIDDSTDWTPKTEQSRRHVEIPAMLREHLLKLAAARKPDELLFGGHWRDWPRLQVQRICDLAKVKRVTAHGMRGLHATLAVDAGAISSAVAAALGHESFTTTRRNYASSDAIERAQQKRALKVLEGGRKEH